MTKRALVYVRQSMDNAEGIDRQVRRCHALVEARDWQLVATLRDNAVSASKSRESAEWAEVIRRAGAGEFDVIVATKLDRIARRVRDVLDLQDLGIAIATLENDIDTTTASGRFQAQLLASLAELEASRKGERHRDAHADRAARGIPRTTKRPYGWKADGIHLEEAEAEHLRIALRSIIAGGSIRGECRRMNDAGARTPSYASGSGGREWTPKTLVSVLDRPRIAGINTYQGVETEHSVIEPVVSREEWEEYRAVRKDPDRLTRKPGRSPLEHWASGVATCPCGATLGASTAQGRGKRYPYYRCRETGPGHVGIAAKTLEAALSRQVYAQIIHRRGRTPEDGTLSGLRLRRREVQRIITEAANTALTSENPTTRKTALGIQTAHEAEDAALSGQIDALLAAGTAEDWAAVADAYLTADDLGQSGQELFETRWAETPVERKREIARQLLTVRVIPTGELVQKTMVRPLRVEMVPAQGADRILVTPRHI